MSGWKWDCEALGGWGTYFFKSRRVDYDGDYMNAGCVGPCRLSIYIS